MTAVRTPTLAAAKLVFQRDMTLAWRRWDEVAQPLIFYVVVTTMFPLATTPDLSALREIGGGVVWVAALLASLLALEALFRADVEDGTTEQWVLSGQPLGYLLLAKVAAHWVLTGLPLVIMSPIVGTGLGLPTSAWGVLMAVAAARHRHAQHPRRHRRGAHGGRAQGQRAAVAAGVAARHAAVDLRVARGVHADGRGFPGRSAAAARGDLLHGVESRTDRNVCGDPHQRRELTGI